MTTPLNNIPRSLWNKVMSKSEALFPPENQYGVFGFGIGRKVIKGLRKQGQLALNVYVKRKSETPRHPIPPIECLFQKKPYLIIPDVIATGQKPRTNWSSSQIFNGLHAGAVIACNSPPQREFGGVACVLTEGNGPSHIITAGHLFPENAEGSSVYAGWPDSKTAIECGVLIFNLLDSNHAGDSDVDAALVELNDAGQELAQESVGGPDLRNLVELNIGETKTAQAFLPYSNDFSVEVEIEYFPNLTYFSADVRNKYYKVVNALRTVTAITDPGASGTILATSKSPASGLGSCIGEFQYHSFFEPFSRSIIYFRKTHSKLKLWRP